MISMNPGTCGLKIARFVRFFSPPHWAQNAPDALIFAVHRTNTPFRVSGAHRGAYMDITLSCQLLKHALHSKSYSQVQLILPFALHLDQKSGLLRMSALQGRTYTIFLLVPIMFRPMQQGVCSTEWPSQVLYGVGVPEAQRGEVSYRWRAYLL
ncbi:hypothetical protein NEOLEDRAFT_226545 [Neolentinus lepideus HHB14362 ss-1]|uniref:Uncharacterized protein n=1 Tax=Neolentinus lepideus HHB14362 ss-1 TaxID=1314782 RepID=A0A165TDL0_9AGAM|nr:hypothetical protein NEOLEDRAFT_226545 [Neolentinus lepideus HHB14362 ss-1]